MSELSITPLGTNGFFSTHGRQTQSYLVRRGGRLLLLDAGTGLGRLLEPGLAGLVAGCERLDILLTHYHLDHTVGLSFLTAVAPSTPVRIFAPAPPLVDGDASCLQRLISPPLFPLRLGEFPTPVEIVPYTGPALEIEGARLRLRRQRHAGGSVGVVIDERLAYLTDSEVDETSRDFVAGVELLLHEVWVTAEEAAAGAQRRGHSTVEEVAALATAAGVGGLLPMHHHPQRTPAALADIGRRLQALTRVSVVMPLEGREVSLPLAAAS